MSGIGTVYLVRHGQTAGNGLRYVGWDDLPLNGTGRDQADAAARALADRRLDRVVCSPLRRALDTARALLAQPATPGLALTCEPALREIHYGQYQGLAKADRPLRLRRDHRELPMPGGESLTDVLVRVSGLALSLSPALARGEAVAVVAHFWSLRLLLGAWRGQGLDTLLTTPDYRPENGSVWQVSGRIEASGRWMASALTPLLLSSTPAPADGALP